MIKRAIEEHVDLNALGAVARSARALELAPSGSRIFDIDAGKREAAEVRITVAFDEAFNFYYQDTLDLLTLHGAELVYFSPIRDKKLPEGVDAVYIGGGFPELYAEELAANTQMIEAIKDFYDGYGVIYAECGGLMYLMERLTYKDTSFAFCGVIRGAVRFGDHRVVNYIEGEFQKDCILGKKGGRFKGHEFHHSDLLLEGTATVDFAYKMLRGVGIKDGWDGIITKNCLASFAHLHAASYAEFADNLVETVRTARSRSR